MNKITKAIVDKLAIPEKGDAFHWDGELKGFGLRVNAAGKSFVVQGRIGSGRAALEARLTIGRYGVFTVDQARNVARDRLRDMRMGIDPRTAAKTTAAQRMTLRVVAERYLTERSLAEKTKVDYGRMLDGPLSGWLDRPLAGITRADVLEKFLEMKGPTPIYANQTFIFLGSIFNAAANDYVDQHGNSLFANSPTKILHDKFAPKQARTGRVPDDKLGEVWEYLQGAREKAAQRETLASIDLVSFLLLTGCRISEASTLDWKNVNLETGMWSIPQPKSGVAIHLPLSSQALAILKSRPTREGYVFATTSGYLKQPKKVLKNVSEVAGLTLSAHDLRRTYSAVGVRLCKIDFTSMERLTGHKAKTVLGISYDNDPRLDYLKPENQAISDRITG